MIPYDIDPSLHGGIPEPEELEDGFSPPHAQAGLEDAKDREHVDVPPEAWLTDKSPY
ncbi:MAG TPA: hypothetical protein VHA82_22640 [Ramlibacter sp.]|uniref:hypothetical protein n=1 Tax=Ramlibacter sp. TaxID=1917967 RepID=UPI002BB54884|nr:hypothetical protein [Ramlibacter sp.]HVZ46621.1 hypothetical protein [Ramlibacter sp.]